MRHIAAREGARVDKFGTSQLVQAYTSDATLLAFAELVCGGDGEDENAVRCSRAEVDTKRSLEGFLFDCLKREKVEAMDKLLSMRQFAVVCVSMCILYLL